MLLNTCFRKTFQFPLCFGVRALRLAGRCIGFRNETFCSRQENLPKFSQVASVQKSPFMHVQYSMLQALNSDFPEHASSSQLSDVDWTVYAPSKGWRDPAYSSSWLQAAT